MKTFYCQLGKYCRCGAGTNYTGNGCIFIKINADTYEEAEKKANEYAESIYGPKTYKDMYYGIKDYNWNITFKTKFFWENDRKAIYNELIYNNSVAKSVVGEHLMKEDWNRILNDFEKNYPIVEI